MSFYQKLYTVGRRILGESGIFKWGFNISPMYRRTTARITDVSDNLHHISIRLPLNYKNKNYVGTIFGGSMFSATDPIFMVQLTTILGQQYVVWDKSASIRFKRPGNTTLYADFDFSEDEIADIIRQVEEKKEIEIVKNVNLTDQSKNTVFCEVEKTIYIADKAFYKQKRKDSKKAG